MPVTIQMVKSLAEFKNRPGLVRKRSARRRFNRLSSAARMTLACLRRSKRATGRGTRCSISTCWSSAAGRPGRRAAIQSAKLGKSVLVVDKGRRLGGVSVHTGTIPSKTLRETVLNLSGWRERGFYGRGYRVKQDISIGDLVAAPAQDARPRGRGAAAPVHAQRCRSMCGATANSSTPNTAEPDRRQRRHQRGRASTTR